MSMTTSRDDAEITDLAGKARGNASFGNLPVTRGMVGGACDPAAAREAAFELSRDRGDESDDA